MKSFYALLLFVVLVACGDSKKDENTTFMPSSNGDLNTIAIVIDNGLWEGNVGEAIRGIFAAPINGLPSDEPIYTLRQIPPQAFDDEASLNRVVLKIEKGNLATATKIENNYFARPQTLAVIGGQTNEGIILQLNENKAKILDAFNKEEVKHKQRDIKKSLLNDDDIEKNLGFSINIPSIYRISKAEDDFYWLRKNLSSSKTIELMLYEVPLEDISEGDSTIVDIVNMRNEITRTKIPGEDGIYMEVEDKYAPSMYKTIIDNKPAYEVRGLWDMQGFTMGGPFITYAIKDEVNKRYVVADGYVYAPSLNKGEYIFELESIIKSIKIK